MQSYPHIFVSSGLNDPRVAYWEPAKWVAKLRTHKQDDNMLLHKVNLATGAPASCCVCSPSTHLRGSLHAAAHIWGTQMDCWHCHAISEGRVLLGLGSSRQPL